MSNPIQDQFDGLPDEIQWALQRADGFMDLKMYSRARETLEAIPEQAQDSLPFRLHRLRLAMEEQTWQDARRLAQALRNDLPGQPFLWIQFAYATRRCRSLDEAKAILLEAVSAFPEDALVPSNLSWYDCRLGELAEARAYLQNAITREPSFRALAMEDEDLEPLWEEIEDL